MIVNYWTFFSPPPDFILLLIGWNQEKWAIKVQFLSVKHKEIKSAVNKYQISLHSCGTLHFMFVQIGKNPIQNAGCYGILQSVQENPDSAIEVLDFSVTCKFRHSFPPKICFSSVFNLFPACIPFQDVTVSQDFEDLYAATKEVFPALTVNHGGRIGAFTKHKTQKWLWSDFKGENRANCCSTGPEKTTAPKAERVKSTLRDFFGGEKPCKLLNSAALPGWNIV